VPHPVSAFVVEYFYWVFIAVLVVNLMQRKYRREVLKKRAATLYVAVVVFAFYIYAYGVIHFNFSDLLLIPYVAVAATLFAVYRRVLFPFAYRCKSCRLPLDFNRILYSDSNLCSQCAEKQASAADGA